MKDKISVVTVTYNCDGILRETIESILEQTYDNIEYVIVDGASKDNTLNIINCYKGKIDVIISEPDKGIYDAMNKALKLISGDWVIFMNAGDKFFNKNVIADCFSKDYKEFAVVFGSWYSKKNGKLSLRDCNRPFYENKSKVRSMGFSHQSVFVRTNWARKFPFDTNFRLCADYNMIFTIYNNGGKFFNTHLPICVYDSEQGASQSNRQLQYKEYGKILGIEDSLYFKAKYSYIVFKNWIKKYINYKQH